MMLPSFAEILVVLAGFALPITYMIIAHLIVKSGETTPPPSH